MQIITRDARCREEDAGAHARIRQVVAEAAVLVEDSSADAEMTLRTLKRRNIANHVEWVKDGAPYRRRGVQIPDLHAYRSRAFLVLRRWRPLASRG